MTSAPFRFAGRLTDLSPADRAALLARVPEPGAAIREEVAAIVARVRAGGDAALMGLARELDGAALDTLEVPLDACRAALAALDPALRRAMERAVRNLRTVHQAELPRPVESRPEPGVTIGRRPDPLDRVGIYAPGGRASYPSSVLMGVVPARIAGVREVVVCSPPAAGGLPAASVLAAAALAGADRVFAAGGAGAVAAMAFGTESIPRVDRIVGPGNAWVAEAKLQVSDVVGIDSPAGPSELLVIADPSAPAELVAREVLAQAEHDPRAAVVVLALGAATAAPIWRAVANALPDAPRRSVIAASLGARGALLEAGSAAEAVEFANAWGAEHLLLAVEDPAALLAGVRGTGAVFLGATSSVTFGDYLSGGNHVLPTGGLARSYSGLSTLDFIRWTAWQRIEPAAAASLAKDAATFAAAEGLPAHAAAAGALSGAAGDDRAPTGPRRPLPRPEFAQVALYRSADAASIDLSDNTNRWGTPPAAARALRDVDPCVASAYPAAHSTELRRAFAGYLGVPAQCIVTGCGSDDVLDSALRAFGRPGDRVAYPDPSFGMVPVFARMNGLVPVGVPLTASGQPDAEAMLAAGAEVIYLCSPNSPTGLAVARDTIEEIVTNARGLVILDEAYAEFAGSTAVDLVRMSERLLVTRTMSKAFGLAGLRIGYGAAAPRIAEAVEKSRGPYKVSAVAERAARAALAQDREWVAARVADVALLRRRFTEALRDAGFAPLPSSANFVLVPVPGAGEIARGMRERGVGVRAFESLTGIGDALRITIAPWDQLATCLQALGEATG